MWVCIGRRRGEVPEAGGGSPRAGAPPAPQPRRPFPLPLRDMSPRRAAPLVGPLRVIPQTSPLTRHRHPLAFLLLLITLLPLQQPPRSPLLLWGAAPWGDSLCPSLPIPTATPHNLTPHFRGGCIPVPPTIVTVIVVVARRGRGQWQGQPLQRCTGDQRAVVGQCQWLWLWEREGRGMWGGGLRASWLSSQGSPVG